MVAFSLFAISLTSIGVLCVRKDSCALIGQRMTQLSIRELG